MKPSILTTALANFDKAAGLLDGQVDSHLLDKVRHPKERIELRLVPQLQDGHLRVFDAFIVRHSDALGPAKGGIRMTPDVTLDDVTGLAMEMAWKCALIGAPFGGGKSGIVADADALSDFDKQSLVRNFARNATRHIGPQVYVPAPDMGTNERDMGYIKDAISYGQGLATTQGCYVTGKPVILGGISGRREATGRGVAMCIAEAMKIRKIKPDGATAIVQGFGNVGAVAAATLAEMGLDIVGISDIRGATFNAKGLDLKALTAHHAQAGTVAGFDGGEDIGGDPLLEQKCDVLVPAAAAGQINAGNAGRITASILAEGANSPTTPEADAVLAERDILVIPDILCNAGGVFVSYLEYTQETQQEQMTLEQVQDRLRRRMRDRFEMVLTLAKEKNIHMREAAMMLAVRTVCEAVTAKGYLP